MPPRDLKARITSALGDRKFKKYFSTRADDESPLEPDTDKLDELVELGLRELAETVPFIVEDDEEFVPSQEGLIPIGSVGQTGNRLLAIHELWIVGDNNTPLKVPTSRTQALDPDYSATKGWVTEGNSIRLTQYIFSSSTTFYKIYFKVVPTETEIADNPLYMRAVTLFAVAAALEDVVSASLTEHTVRLEGTPDIRDTSEQLTKQINFMRSRARQMLGEYVAIL